jgi:hypothetical protein
MTPLSLHFSFLFFCFSDDSNADVYRGDNTYAIWKDVDWWDRTVVSGILIQRIIYLTNQDQIHSFILNWISMNLEMDNFNDDEFIRSS